MDGKQYFIDYCLEKNISWDDLFKIGQGKGKSKGVFKYDCKHIYRKDSQIFAIKYFEKEELYIAWNLKKRIKTQDQFTLQESKIIKHTEDDFLKVSSPVEFKGRREEIDFVFTKDGIPKFLEMCL